MVVCVLSLTTCARIGAVVGWVSICSGSLATYLYLLITWETYRTDPVAYSQGVRVSVCVFVCKREREMGWGVLPLKMMLHVMLARSISPPPPPPNRQSCELRRQLQLARP